ncbi:uncharacterized protein [Malus domestica]|uniref:uncharacterized protein n=1 Tax=Malus domestica TaxID=3750 RepID=UPI003975A583
MQTSLKLASFAITTYYLLLLLPLVGCSFHEDVNQHSSHNNIKENIHKLSPRMTSNVTVHGLLAWFSIGFLMPLGILVIRMSVREERGTTRAKVLFYLHVILQMLSVLVATAGAVMSLRNFENSFNNHHQRLGLALYGSIWIQTLIGFFRPHRGKKEWSFWYLAHWMLGTMISLFGIINIYTGLEAYHKRTQRSSGLWTILFTAEVSFIAACYLFQDKRDYIQKQGVISNLEQPITIRQQDEETAQRQQQIQRDLLPDQQPCGKVNALKNLFIYSLNSNRGRRNQKSPVTNQQFQSYGKMAAEDEEPKKRRMVVESLGWLTESSIMPKKHRAIAGVGASSIMELKAQLYQSQEESKKSKELAGSDIEFHRAKKRITAHDGFSAKNSGVDARAHKDKLELKAVHDGSASYAALERKAALYDKLARGELSDEEDKEKYCVDFFGKRVEQDEPQQTQHRDSPAVVSPENQDGEINASTLFSTKPLGLGRADATVDNDIHKRFVREVHEEANQAREMASKLKLRREEQAAARREKLKQAYIRKQLERLKTASCNKEQTE